MSVATPSTYPIPNYSQFWPHYLREHSKPATRALHYAGTLAFIFVEVFAIYSQSYRLIPLGVFVGKLTTSLSDGPLAVR